ncbi:MAG: glycosyltransferase [Bacteroidota bacterium]
MTRVLILTFWYPTPGSHLGIFIKEYAAAISRAGADVTVLAIVHSAGPGLLNGKVQSFKDESGVQTRLLHLRGMLHNAAYNNPWLLFRYVRKQYAEILKSGFKPDIIHAQVLYPGAAIGRMLADFTGLPFMLTEHWSGVARYMKHNKLAWLGRRAYAEARAITVVSQFLYGQIEGFIADKSKIALIPNVIDADIFTYKPKPDPEKGFIEIFSVMNLTPPKRPEVVIPALAAIRKKGFNLRYTIAGYGEMQAMLEKLAAENGLPMRFIGRSEKAEIAALMQQSHIFLHPSDYETFGIVAREALATGTPVVCSNLPAMREMMNPGDGFICENTPESWEWTIERALKTDWDYADISNRNRKRYSAETVGNAFNDLYTQVLAKEPIN